MLKYFGFIWEFFDNFFNFQDPNQLIRASALRVLSSIRVSMIVPIMMLAIKEAVMDMSPYVRKTAAHAIPKLYRWTWKMTKKNLNFFFSLSSMDIEQKDILIEVIEKLLADKTTVLYQINSFYLFKTCCFMLTASGWECNSGFWGGLSWTQRPHSQELPQAVQPPGRRRGVGTGGHHQHADPIRSHAIRGSESGGLYIIMKTVYLSIYLGCYWWGRKGFLWIRWFGREVRSGWGAEACLRHGRGPPSAAQSMQTAAQQSQFCCELNTRRFKVAISVLFLGCDGRGAALPSLCSEGGGRHRWQSAHSAASFAQVGFDLWF